MRLSTTSSIMGVKPGGGKYSFSEAVEALRAAGYRYVDASLWQQGGHGMPLDTDGWREWCVAEREHAENIGIEFCQTHGQTLSGVHWDEPEYVDREFIFNMNFRCVEATSLLGAKWMVMHPYNLPHDALYDPKKAKEACISHLAPYIEHAKKFGVGIAVENMVDFGRFRRRYCGGDIYELCELIDTINDPDVGICLDTGHANESGASPAAAARLIGKRLVAMHINDNHKSADEHLMPFFGDINWAELMRALGEIGYNEDFSFEAGSQKIPDVLRPAWLRYTYELGMALIDMSK